MLSIKAPTLDVTGDTGREKTELLSPCTLHSFLANLLLIQQ